MGFIQWHNVIFIRQNYPYWRSVVNWFVWAGEGGDRFRRGPLLQNPGAGHESLQQVPPEEEEDRPH